MVSAAGRVRTRLRLEGKRYNTWLAMGKLHWQGKTAVVCGATAGLGKEIALRLAAGRIARLVLIARDMQRLDELQQQIRSQFPAVEIASYSADLCQKDVVVDVASKAESRFGKVDLLIQAVGLTDRGTIIDLDANRLTTILDANVKSSLNAIQSFRPALRAPGGAIVLIGSLASLFAPRYLGAYAIAKHALAAVAQQARLELSGDGLHVLLACPGPIANADGSVRATELPARDGLPDSAMEPGGGAKVRGLDPSVLANDILRAAARRKPLMIRPRKARLLLAIAALSPKLGDYLLRKQTS